MSDEIFRLLPVLISPVSHYKLPHSENGNGWRWRWRWRRKEGLTEAGEGGRQDGDGEAGGGEEAGGAHIHC